MRATGSDSPRIAARRSAAPESDSAQESLDEVRANLILDGAVVVSACAEVTEGHRKVGRGQRDDVGHGRTVAAKGAGGMGWPIVQSASTPLC
jgi:hypothetical protein